MQSDHNIGLKVHSLSKTYDEFSLYASFEVAQGEFVTIVGPSGCGKSTLLSLICGLLQPDSGSVELNGRSMEDDAIWDRNIGMVFQNYALFPNMSIGKNIGYGMKMRKYTRSAIEERVNALTAAFNIDSLKQRRPDSLSGGEQQRAALARALAVKPDLLLLDEPLSAIDAAMRVTMRNEIRMVQRNYAITTLYVTHDQDEALAISDRVIIMRNGSIIQQGTPEQVYREPNSLFCAHFFGRSTLIPARLLSDGEAGDPLLLSKASPGERFTSMQGVGTAAGEYFLHFRPEDAEIVSDSKSGANILQGVIVRQVEFCGSGYYLYGDWNHENVTVLSRNRVSAGSQVSIQLPQEKLWCLRASQR